MHTQQLPVHNPGGLGVFALMAQALMDSGWPSNRAPSRGELDRPTHPAADKPRRRGLLERLERRFWEQEQRDIERYLAQASDIHDLETRMQMIERRDWRSY